jgi:hypothetical protein
VPNGTECAPNVLKAVMQVFEVGVATGWDFLNNFPGTKGQDPLRADRRTSLGGCRRRAPIEVEADTHGFMI